MTPRQLAHAERADLAAFLQTLSPAEWDAPSLCPGWRVRDVVAHVISYEELGAAGLAKRLVRGGFFFPWMNAIGVAEFAERDTSAVLATVLANLEPRGITSCFGGRVGLMDCLIHHQDIRRALGKPREIPADRLRVALGFARVAPPIRAFWRARGLRLVATDVDWSFGRGPEVRGPGEALLMAIAGRRAAAGDLTGPGQPTLLARLGPAPTGSFR